MANIADCVIIVVCVLLVVFNHAGVLDLDVWCTGAKAAMASRGIKMPYADLTL